MGIDYTAMVIVGVPGEVLLRKETISSKKKVTKYDSDTGKPYEKEVTDMVTKNYWLGKPIEDEYPDNHGLAESIGLEYILSCSMTGNGPFYGLELASLTQYDSVNYQEIDMNDVNSSIEEVNEQLSKCGILENAKLYLVYRIS